MAYPNPDIRLLQASIDPDPGQESEIRILVDNKYVKYITISGGVYDPDDMCFEPALVSLLPSFPIGDWNVGRISRNVSSGLPHFEMATKEALPAVDDLWHPFQVDHLELKMGRKLRSNVYESVCPNLGPEPVVAKFARFPWEIAQLATETTAYKWIEGHKIGPAFLGHITEEGRAIGFLMARVDDKTRAGVRHATEDDLSLCQAVLQKLHSLFVRHGDTNKHNFLIHDSRATLIDFDFASRPAGLQELEDEMRKLVEDLRDSSGRGGIGSE